MLLRRSRRAPAALLAILTLLAAQAALAGIHTWDVREVFSNADGSIQFVEFWEAGGGPGETGIGSAAASSDTQSFSWSNGAVAPPTSNKFYLIATADFAALPGAPTPDVIIPAINVPFFDPAGDTVCFGGFDCFTFASAPTNGTDSLDDISGVGPNTPTNYAGVSGSVTIPPSAPAWSSIAMLLATASMLLIGLATTRRARRTTASPA
jgi:uncharacterized membrane protein YphA (DoxX/SURF4 family)